MSDPSAEPTIADIALDKIGRVFGPERRAEIYRSALESAGLQELRTPDDLFVFAAALSKRGPMEAAVGGLLSVAAVLRGAGAGRAG